jgi:GT2 family glycosyltransferase
MNRSGIPSFVRVGQRVPELATVSVCILVLERVRLVERCLNSLRSCSANASALEIVVVANGTSPAGLRALETHQDIVLVRSKANLGFAGGNNLAAEIARGDFLLFLNDDSTVESSCIEKLVVTTDGDPSIGAVGCRILNADGSLQEAGAVLWSDGSTTHAGRGLPPGTNAYCDTRDVDYASANGILIRRAAWDAVGGFDEGYYPAYYEDVDLCMMMRRHGYRVVYEPRARLRHLESQSTSGWYRAFLMERNRKRFVAKWGPDLEGFTKRPKGNGAALERAISRAGGTPPHRVDPSAHTGGYDSTPPADVREHPHPPGLDSGDGDGDVGLDQAWRQIGQLERERLALVAEGKQRERELRHAQADLRVRDEYRAFLEKALEVRNAYLSARPSIRLKKRLFGTRNPAGTAYQRSPDP